METPPHSKPLKAKTFSLVTLLLCLPLVEGNVSPHHPVNLTWLIYNLETGGPLNSSSSAAPKGTWWPELTFDLCVLAAAGFGYGPHQLGNFFKSGVGLPTPQFKCINSFELGVYTPQKQRNYFASKGLSSQSYGFSSSHVWM